MNLSFLKKSLLILLCLTLFFLFKLITLLVFAEEINNEDFKLVKLQSENVSFVVDSASGAIKVQSQNVSFSVSNSFFTA